MSQTTADGQQVIIPFRLDQVDAAEEGMRRLTNMIHQMARKIAYTIGFLQTGDHDHREVVQPLVALEAFEHLKAVQLGHQQVEQNQIKLLDL